MPILPKPGKDDKNASNGKQTPANKKNGAAKEMRTVLRLRVDAKRLTVRRDDLHDGDRLADLEKRLRIAKKIDIKNVASLLDIPPGERIWLLRLFANLADGTRLLDGDDDRANIFDVVAKMEFDFGDLQQVGRWQTAALEAGVVTFPGNLELPVGEIRSRLKELGKARPRLDVLVKQAQTILGQLQKASVQSQDFTAIKSLFPDAPVADDVRLPAGWNVTPNGIGRIGSDEPVVAKAPLVLIGRFRHLQDEVEYVELAFLVDGQWRRRIVPRCVIADRNKLIHLAAFGVAVTSNSTAALVEYLAAFEAENAGILLTENITGHMGWHRINGEDVFIWGETLIRNKAGEDGDVPPPSIRFVASDNGNQQISEALKSKGKFDTWRSAIQLIETHPRVLLAVFTALAAPLLKIVGVPSFIVDYAAETSTGKTTSLRIAASVWGNPEECGPDRVSLVLSWDITPTCLERSAATLQSIPLMVDETKRAQWPAETLPKSVYAFCAGRGRGRGSIDGVRASATWATTMLSSGEQPITSFARDGGTHARVIQHWGPPFGQANETTAGLVNLLNEALRLNFGHAGPRFVRWLLHHRDQWSQFRSRFAAIRAELLAHSNGKPLAMRLCASMAVICLAEELAHDALNLPTGHMGPLSIELLQEFVETDRAAEALRYVLDWARGNHVRFYRITGPTRPVVGGEWVGRWDGPDAQFVGVLPPTLEQVLREGGFCDFRGLVASWRDRGWLVLGEESEGSARTRLRTRIGEDHNARVIAIRRSAIEEVDPPGEDAVDDSTETDPSDDEFDDSDEDEDGDEDADQEEEQDDEVEDSDGDEEN